MTKVKNEGNDEKFHKKFQIWGNRVTFYRILSLFDFFCKLFNDFVRNVAGIQYEYFNLIDAVGQREAKYIIVHGDVTEP